MPAAITAEAVDLNSFTCAAVREEGHVLCRPVRGHSVLLPRLLFPVKVLLCCKHGWLVAGVDNMAPAVRPLWQHVLQQAADISECHLRQGDYQRVVMIGQADMLDMLRADGAASAIAKDRTGTLQGPQQKSSLAGSTDRLLCPCNPPLCHWMPRYAQNWTLFCSQGH